MRFAGFLKVKVKVKTVGGGPTASNFFVFDGAVAFARSRSKSKDVGRPRQSLDPKR
jgi:hypothetical protein